jgi:hypothetical protein
MASLIPDGALPPTAAAKRRDEQIDARFISCGVYELYGEDWEGMRLGVHHPAIEWEQSVV